MGLNWKKTFSDIRIYCMQHKAALNLGVQVLGVVQSIKEKKYLDTVRIAVDSFEKLSGSDYYATTFFNEETGWKPLFDKDEGKIGDIYLELLSKYLKHTIKLYNIVHIYEIQSNIQILSYEKGYYWDSQNVVLYNSNLCDKETVRDILINKLFENLNSNFIQIFKEEKTNIEIIPTLLNEYPSQMADELFSYFNRSLEKNITRAIMLCGEPGAGKSCVSSTILKRLNKRTLIIKDFNKIGYDTLKAAINLLKIEAILIDDFDHTNIGDNSLILGFLEQIRNNVKVILATVNSTQKFHKALIRPGRFDKIILSNRLDEGVIKTVLGKELLEYFDKVKDWPIAYINEFVLSVELEGKDKITPILNDLQKRVANNTLDLLNNNTDKKIDEDLNAAKTA